MHPSLKQLAVAFERVEISRRELIWRARGFVGGLALTSFLATCGVQNASASAPATKTRSSRLAAAASLAQEPKQAVACSRTCSEMPV